jgi:hypothetical protein
MATMKATKPPAVLAPVRALPERRDDHRGERAHEASTCVIGVSVAARDRQTSSTAGAACR